MSVTIVVEQRGAGKAALDLHALGVRSQDVRPLWPELNDLFRSDERGRFAAQGIPRWAPLAEQTLANKALLGQEPTIMRATDELYRSLTTAALGRSGSGTRLEFGTDVPYARFHQYGTTKMPRRKVVGVTASTRKRMVRTITDFVAKGRRR